MDNIKINEFRDRIVDSFGPENVVCILLHGSILFNPQSIPQDVDLVIVLRNKNRGDCSLLRELAIRTRITRIPVQIHLIYSQEIPIQADFFSIHTCGSFFVWHLRQANVLYGENIFDTLNGPSDYQLQLSILQKIQQYTFQLRNSTFKIGRISEKDLHQAKKRSILVLKDLLISTGKLIQREKDIVNEAFTRFPNFNSKEQNFLRELVGEWKKPSSEKKSRQFLHLCLSIHERAYEIMRSQIEDKTSCKFMI
jgi:hypothetical protein